LNPHYLLRACVLIHIRRWGAVAQEDMYKKTGKEEEFVMLQTTDRFKAANVKATSRCTHIIVSYQQ
jgi:hypothetical protein